MEGEKSTPKFLQFGKAERQEKNSSDVFYHVGKIGEEDRYSDSSSSITNDKEDECSDEDNDLPSYQHLQSVKKHYQDTYGEENCWKDSINESISETVAKMQSKEEDMKARFEEILKVESAALDFKKELEERQKEFEEEKQKMKQVNEIQENMIRLNVGGQYFTTSKTTLCAEKDSMLAIMFSGYHSLNKPEDGSYFIDADGTHFQTILNYLRGRIKDTCDLPEEKKTLLKLQKEADFYQLRVLKAILSTATEKKKRPPVSQQWINEFFDSDDDRVWRSKHSLNFQNLNLDGLSFSKMSFDHNVTFRNASLVGADFQGCSYKAGVKIDLSCANVKKCDFRGFITKSSLKTVKYSPPHVYYDFTKIKNIADAYFDVGVLKKIESERI